MKSNRNWGFARRLGFVALAALGAFSMGCQGPTNIKVVDSVGCLKGVIFLKDSTGEVNIEKRAYECYPWISFKVIPHDEWVMVWTDGQIKVEGWKPEEVRFHEDGNPPEASSYAILGQTDPEDPKVWVSAKYSGDIVVPDSNIPPGVVDDTRYTGYYLFPSSDYVEEHSNH